MTITNLNWLPVLNKDHHKQIVVEALRHRVKADVLTLYAFVLMPNHFHAIWQIHDHVKKEDFMRDLLKFTARSILNFMRMHEDPMLNSLLVNAADRKYQVWERNSLGFGIYSHRVFVQKLDYIHWNPLQPRWNLCSQPEEYYYSSALFYETGGKEGGFDMLTHFRD